VFVAVVRHAGAGVVAARQRRLHQQRRLRRRQQQVAALAGQDRPHLGGQAQPIEQVGGRPVAIADDVRVSPRGEEDVRHAEAQRQGPQLLVQLRDDVESSGRSRPGAGEPGGEALDVAAEAGADLVAEGREAQAVEAVGVEAG